MLCHQPSSGHPIRRWHRGSFVLQTKSLGLWGESLLRKPSVQIRLPWFSYRRKGPKASWRCGRPMHHNSNTQAMLSLCPRRRRCRGPSDPSRVPGRRGLCHRKVSLKTKENSLWRWPMSILSISIFQQKRPTCGQGLFLEVWLLVQQLGRTSASNRCRDSGHSMPIFPSALQRR